MDELEELSEEDALRRKEMSEQRAQRQIETPLADLILQHTGRGTRDGVYFRVGRGKRKSHALRSKSDPQKIREDVDEAMRFVEDELGEAWEESAGWLMDPKTGKLLVVHVGYPGSGRATKDRESLTLCARMHKRKPGPWPEWAYCTRLSVADNPEGFCNVCAEALEDDISEALKVEEEHDLKRRERALLNLQGDELEDHWQQACDLAGVADDARGERLRIAKGWQGRYTQVDPEALKTILACYIEQR